MGQPCSIAHLATWMAWVTNWNTFFTPKQLKRPRFQMELSIALCDYYITSLHSPHTQTHTTSMNWSLLNTHLWGYVRLWHFSCGNFGMISALLCNIPALSNCLMDRLSGLYTAGVMQYIPIFPPKGMNDKFNFVSLQNHQTTSQTWRTDAQVWTKYLCWHAASRT